MDECPRCQQPVREGAVSCACGWRARTRAAKERPPLPHIQCSHETCGLSARVRVQTATGWADLCEPHYLRHHEDRACRYYVEQGLERGDDETKEQHRKRVFAWLREHSKLKTFDVTQEEGAA